MYVFIGPYDSGAMAVLFPASWQSQEMDLLQLEANEMMLGILTMWCPR